MNSYKKDIDHEDDNIINITHFINPHMFWYQYESQSNKLSKKRFLFERDMQDHYQYSVPETLNESKIKINDTVAAYFTPWKKWIRAEVIEIAIYPSHKMFYLWAIDYGFPLECRIKYINLLKPDFIDVNVNSIHLGGINNVLPAQKNFDFLKNKPINELQQNWSKFCIDDMELLITTAGVIRFTVQRVINNHTFGKLEFSTFCDNENIKCDFGDLLISDNGGIKSINFPIDIQKKIRSTKFKWYENNDSVNIIERVHNRISCNSKKILPYGAGSLNYDSTFESVKGLLKSRFSWMFSNTEKSEDIDKTTTKKLTCGSDIASPPPTSVIASDNSNNTLTTSATNKQTTSQVIRGVRALLDTLKLEEIDKTTKTLACSNEIGPVIEQVPPPPTTMVVSDNATPITPIKRQTTSEAIRGVRALLDTLKSEEIDKTAKMLTCINEVGPVVKQVPPPPTSVIVSDNTITIPAIKRQTTSEAIRGVRALLDTLKSEEIDKMKKLAGSNEIGSEVEQAVPPSSVSVVVSSDHTTTTPAIKRQKSWSECNHQ